MSDACTWPEQDVIDAWCKKHGVEISHQARMELKNDVTAIRLRHQRRADDLEKELAILRGK